ncbi:MAG: HD domain-containing protein [Nitrospirae bacterium]|nr:HD domain-containing protein [Nitrospirota bacterium]
MNKETILKKTEDYVKKQMESESSGHDWWHIYRVWKTAIHIGKEEKADIFTIQLAALLHDIADHKFHGGDLTVGPRVAGEWLEGLNVDKEVIANVCEIIKDISFKGAGVETPMRTQEGMVVQDADRLDAIGAIGIARAFAYGGYKGLEIYNPDIKPAEHETFEQYKNNKGPSINHFYEKLLLLKDMMNTKTAKKMAEERHHYMEGYLDRFYKEWEGEE